MYVKATIKPSKRSNLGLFCIFSALKIGIGVLFVLNKIAKEYISDKPKNSNPAAIRDNIKRKDSLNLNSFAKVFMKSIKTPINIKDKIFLEKMIIVNYTLKYG